jgi:hypothetical protein
MVPYTQRFTDAFMNAQNLGDKNTNFAQLVFNSLKSRSWMHITIELMRIFVFFDTKEYSSDHYKDNLTRKLYSFVYNQVGKPMLLNVERAPMNGRTTSKSDENWSDSLYLLNAEDSAGQDEILAKMYSWSEIPGQQAPPEKLILNVLKKELPKNDHSTRHASATGRIRASSKANNVKKPTTASPLPLPSMMHTADPPSISVPPTETAFQSPLPDEPIRTNTSHKGGTTNNDPEPDSVPGPGPENDKDKPDSLDIVVVNPLSF